MDTKQAAADSRPRPAPDEELFSVGRVAEITGLSPHTIRVWERRYGRPAAQRLPSGHRRYTREQAGWLCRVASALAAGFAPSRVIELDDDALEALLRAVDGDPDAGAIDELIELGAAHRIDDLIERLRHEAERLPLARFLAGRVAPLVRRIGWGWSRGELDIRHEHRVTAAVEDLLREMLIAEGRPDGRRSVVLATLSGERHTLGLRMAALLCAHHGWRVHFLGSDLPAEEIVATARETGASAVGISVSSATAGSLTDSDVRSLRQALPRDVALFVGGVAASGPRRRLPGARYFPRIDALDEWLSQRAREEGVDV